MRPLRSVVATAALVTCLSLAIAAGSRAARAEGLDCSRPRGTLPDPTRPVGTPDASIPIEHIIVIMQENHSFDTYFGHLNDPELYGNEIDGPKPEHFQLDAKGNRIGFYHTKKLCITDTNHQWNAVHRAWDNGKSDRWAVENGKKVMAYYDRTDLPYYYALANTFATADRYFCPMLGGTDINRHFLYAGTAFGHIGNDFPFDPNEYDPVTIFDAFDMYGVTWRYYTGFLSDYLSVFHPLHRRAKHEGRIKGFKQFAKDLKAGDLPQVIVLDSAEGYLQDEHPAAEVEIGQKWVADRIRELMKSRYWKSSALFLTYDENGAAYDHVVPGPACVPDDIPPRLGPGDEPGGYDNYGLRVPFIAVSPFAKHHYVSHVTFDHTSILKFIETKFNLPALTRRDANANDMLDLFDFEHPDFRLPKLPKAKVNGEKVLSCLLGQWGN